VHLFSRNLGDKYHLTWELFDGNGCHATRFFGRLEEECAVQLQRNLGNQTALQATLRLPNTVSLLAAVACLPHSGCRDRTPAQFC